MGNDRSWMRLSPQTQEWQIGLNKFIEHTFAGTSKGERAPYPYMRCHTMCYRTINEVRAHLLHRGFSDSFIQGEVEKKIHLRALVNVLAMRMQQVTMIL